MHLARAGQIELLRKGKPVDDPARVKGVVRYRLPESGATPESSETPEAPEIPEIPELPEA